MSRQLAALAATKLSKEEVGLADELLRSYKHSGESPVRSLIMLYNHREVLEKELQSVFMKAVPSEKLAGPARLSRASSGMPIRTQATSLAAQASCMLHTKETWAGSGLAGCRSPAGGPQ